MVEQNILLLGVDGGGTQSRARLSTYSGGVLAEAVSGPANLRLGIGASFSSVVDAARRCFDGAGIAQQNISRIVACLALAGASEPRQLAAAKQYGHPFRMAVITTDAHAACIGAHGGKDGGVIIAGTGAVGWAVIKEQTYRIGGWGLPISDEGSGAWIGIEALRRVLWAHDGRIAWTPLLRLLFTEFANDPHAIVGWTATASRGNAGRPGGCASYSSTGSAISRERASRITRCQPWQSASMPSTACAEMRAASSRSCVQRCPRHQRHESMPAWFFGRTTA